MLTKLINTIQIHPIRAIIIVITITISFGLTVTGIWAYQRYQKAVIRPDNQITFASNQPTPTPDPLAPYNVLIVGYGGTSHEGGKLTDTIILANIAPRTKQVTLISIPRDLWVPLEIKPNQPTYFKINAAYAIGSDDRDYPHKPQQYTGETGGYQMVTDSIELVTGQSIYHFIAISFDDFTKAIDALHGVTLTLTHPFDDYFYPLKGKETDPCDKPEAEIAALTATMSGYLLEQQFTCRFEHLHFDKGTQTFDGATALKFVRSRHSQTAGNDFNRSERQQAVISGVIDKLLNLGSLPKLIPFLTKISTNLETTFDISTLTTILQTHENPEQFTIRTINLTTDNVLAESRSSDRQYILVPKSGPDNWTSIHNFIKDQLASSSALPK